MRQLKYNDRLKLESWLTDGVSKPVIAERLGCCLKTVYNEIERGTYRHLNSDYTYSDRYSCDLAESKYQSGLRHRGIDLKIGNDLEYANYLENKIIDDNYSPAAALHSAGSSFKTKICLTTLYSYIKKGIFLNLNKNDLPSSRKQKKTHFKRAKRASSGTSIDDRPGYIAERGSFGHWEMDSVVGPQSGKHNNLFVLTERVSRYELIFKLPDKTAHSVVECLQKLCEAYPDFKKVFKTITCDNGVEFSDFEHMQQLTDIYYCHPYSSWERGSNENNNRLIRRHIPKGTNFDALAASQVDNIQNWINTYPRKLLNWQTSQDVFKYNLRRLRLSYRRFVQIVQQIRI
jgi:IS30 family transposase